jgi:SCY1-like protein 1
MVSEKVYPNLTAGFQDTVPQLKEATVKGVLSLVGKLSEKLINNDLINHLCQLQFDQIPGIRANTVIGLGKIAKYLNSNNQKKKLGPTLIKSLKDPFPHSKMAALMALGSTVEYYDAADCANIILPAIVTVVIDPVRMVREQAFKTIDVYVKKLSEHSKDMVIYMVYLY